VAGVDVVKAVKETHDGGLAGARRANYGNGFACGDLET